MRAHAVAAIAAGILIAAAGAAADAGPHDVVAVCLDAAQRVQDEARALRNGSVAGRDAQALGAQRDRISVQIRALEACERRWLATLDEEARVRVHEEIAWMEDDRLELQKHLGELDHFLAALPLDREAIEEVGRAVGRHALSWRQALRRAVTHET
jgi:hypothetical protein